MKSAEKSLSSMFNRRLSRRNFLASGAVLAAACLFPRKAVSAVSSGFFEERALHFYNTHTDEQLKAVYWSGGEFVPEVLADINHILRDHRTGAVKEINTRLLDLLFDLRQKLESDRPFHIISGYRSPETNSLLHTLSKGVASSSLHIDGKAIDIRLPGHELKTVQRAAVALQMGGVGYYPASDFVHVDVGRIRYW
jgi:uncharacterized protein YcbK (DUF882 family)